MWLIYAVEGFFFFFFFVQEEVEGGPWTESPSGNCFRMAFCQGVRAVFCLSAYNLVLKDLKPKTHGLTLCNIC